MLLNSEYELINQLKIELTFDNDVVKKMIVKVGDIVRCTYNDQGNRSYITGKINKIGVNYHSTLGEPIDATYLQIDGSQEYCGKVIYIKPEQILDLTICQTTDDIINPVCSVDNENQKILLIRENEVGVFQYSKDGLTWIDVNPTAQQPPVTP